MSTTSTLRQHSQKLGTINSIKRNCIALINRFNNYFIKSYYCFTPCQRLWLYNGAPLVAFYDTLGIRRTYSRLKPPASSRGILPSNVWTSLSLYFLNSFEQLFYLQIIVPPWGPGGFKSRMCPPYPQRDRKRRLNGAVCRNHRIKRVVPCRC